MKEFVPDEMLSFTLEKGSTETFFEEVHEPTNIRGAYFVSYDSSEKINFKVYFYFLLQIISPTENVVFEKKKRRESIFNIDVTELGSYTFLFENKRGK